MQRVKGAFFSFTPTAPEGDDGSYLRWHLLDHMPEQFQLPGMVLATRWIADGELLERRLAAEGRFATLGGVVNYLVGDPVQQTHDDFMELGRRLAEAGRFPERRPSLSLRLLALQRWYASPAAQVSAEVVPFRPHRGVLLLVEEPVAEDVSPWLQWLHAEHVPTLLDVPGVAGSWQYGATTTWALHRNCEDGPLHVTVVYLDADPVATAEALTRVVERRWASGEVRPVFAGPLRSMVRWEAWPA